ncbi:MAG TPA: hypothetical protein VGH49_19570 [Xanthobacteraceae bacterium]|jgi:hypothetical protein
MPNQDGAGAIANFEALAEAAYERMYESRNPAADYADVKDFFAAAIGAATRAGLGDEVARLTERLEQCRAVYRSQFSSF